MADFALVIFEQEDKKTKSLTGLLHRMGFYRSRLGSGIFYFLNRKAFIENIRRAQVDETINVLVIKLPFVISRLKDFNFRFINGYINKTCTKGNVGDIYMPADCSTSYSQLYRPKLPVNLIFKSLLLPVLDEIYTKSGLRMGSLDIIVVPGNDAEELYSIVRLLEPRIGFLTIAAADRTQFDAGLSAIAEETGLSISISSDFRNTLKNAELIINLEDTAVISRYRLKPKSLVVNFYGPGKSKITGENTVINGAEYELPESVKRAVGPETMSFFGKKEIADIYICQRLGLSGDCRFSTTVEREVRGLFDKIGMCITGFTGRRGVLRVENVLKAVRM